MSDTNKAAPTNTSTKLFGTALRKHRERLRLDMEIRREFAKQSEGERQGNLRRRTYYSMLDGGIAL